MIERKIVNFGNARIAVIEEKQPNGCILTVTCPLRDDHDPDWAELERTLMATDSTPIPEAS